MKTEEPEVNLLSDDPTDHDEFGSHQRIADAIKQLIKEQPGGKSICVDGSRGSGKSTIIRLLSDVLSNDDDLKCHFFMFDVWAHQKDPLKRSFLEEFISSLKNNLYTKRINYERYIKLISGKIRKVTLKGTRFLTKEGAVFAIAFMFTPFGTALFPSFADHFFKGFNWVSLFMLIPLLFCLSPFIVAFVYKFINKDTLKWFPAMIKNDYTEELTTETLVTADPTAIEFRKYFVDLVEKSILNNPVKLVIVVDNLDRLEPDEAIDFWASLRIFFEHNIGNPPSWFRDFWLVIPIDIATIENYWKKQMKIDFNMNNNDNNVMQMKDNAQSFIDKTFQAVFSVRVPILSDWEKYFKKQLRNALHNINYEEESIFRIFAIHKESAGLSVTPREIIVFVNNLTSLYMQWKNIIDLEIMTAYLLYRDNIKDPYNSINNMEFIECDNYDKKQNDELKHRIGRYLDNNAEEQFAALYFNIEVERAAEALLEKPVKEALISRDEQGLMKASDVTGFDSVLSLVINRNATRWASDNPVVITNSAFLLKFLGDNKKQQQEHLWDTLAEAAADVGQWPRPDKQLAEDIILLVDRVQER